MNYPAADEFLKKFNSCIFNRTTIHPFKGGEGVLQRLLEEIDVINKVVRSNFEQFKNQNGATEFDLAARAGEVTRAKLEHLKSKNSQPSYAVTAFLLGLSVLYRTQSRRDAEPLKDAEAIAAFAKLAKADETLLQQGLVYPAAVEAWDKLIQGQQNTDERRSAVLFFTRSLANDAVDGTQPGIPEVAKIYAALAEPKGPTILQPLVDDWIPPVPVTLSQRPLHPKNVWVMPGSREPSARFQR